MMHFRVVITGSWLPYNDIKRDGIAWYEVESINMLSRLLGEMNANQSWILTREKIEKNREIIASLSSWNVVIHDWMELLRA